jgi:NAD(P)-dependent dehydrogenase (short-subunit alcohol dehydrogenase family)
MEPMNGGKMSASLFDQKVVLVTGASGGIGRAIARGFAAAGASVVVHYHNNTSRAEGVVAEIEKDGGKAVALSADLTRPAEVDALFAEILARFGGLDVLINNAGVYLASASITEMDPADWQRMIDADLNSVFLCTRAAARMMIDRGVGGSIVNIASVEGMFPVKGHSYYNTSKAGLIMFTRSSAQEFGQYKIRVNTVSPGLIWKEGIEQSWPDGVKSWLRNAPLGQMGQPEDIANACLFLSSNQAGFISGTNLVVDGGYSARVIH